MRSLLYRNESWKFPEKVLCFDEISAIVDFQLYGNKIVSFPEKLKKFTKPKKLEFSVKQP